MAAPVPTELQQLCLRSWHQPTSKIDRMLTPIWSVQFLDGATLTGVALLNKIVRKMVDNETHIFTLDNPRFIYGEGYKTLV